MKRERNLTCLLTTLAIAFMASGCTPKGSDGGGTGKPKLRVGMVTFPGYAPLYLARDKGLFSGVDVELVRIESISDLRAAMKAHKIDMYLATYDIFQSAASEEPPGVAFFAVDESHGADGVAAGSDIHSISDLKGKPVAAEPGFPPYFVLQYSLHSAGLTLKDITFKDMASQDAGTAFAAGRFPAVGTYEPYLSKSIQQRQGAHLLASSKDLPGLIVDFAFVDEDILKSNKPALKSFAEGWLAALKYLKSNPDDAMTVMAKDFNVSKQDMIDFHSGVSWLGLDRNKDLFNKKVKGNAYTTYDLVGEILDSNGARQIKTKSDQKLDGSVVESLTD